MSPLFHSGQESEVSILAELAYDLPSSAYTTSTDPIKRVQDLKEHLLETGSLPSQGEEKTAKSNASSCTPENNSKLPLPAAAARSLLLIVLLADTPNPAVLADEGDYADIFTSLFKNAIDYVQDSQRGAQTTASKEESASSVLEIESYDVVTKGNYPSEERLRQADAVLITGSAASAYLGLPWISKLVEYTASLPILKPSIKIFGICFGHQIISRAFGGTVEKNVQGWEIGVRKLELTAVGRKLLGSDYLPLHQMHQDHVPQLPEGFELLASSPICLVHGMVKMSKSGEEVEILTVQGHPEFTSPIVNKMIDARELSGVFPPPLVKESRVYAEEENEGLKYAGVLLGIMGL